MPKLTNSLLIILSILLTMFCYSCREADKHKDIDVETEGKSLNPLRFDQDFFNMGGHCLNFSVWESTG